MYLITAESYHIVESCIPVSLSPVPVLTLFVLARYKVFCVWVVGLSELIIVPVSPHDSSARGGAGVSDNPLFTPQPSQKSAPFFCHLIQFIPLSFERGDTGRVAYRPSHLPEETERRLEEMRVAAWTKICMAVTTLWPACTLHK